MAKSDTVRIALFGFEGCSAWITAGMLEFFALSNLVAGRQRARVRFKCEIVTAEGGALAASHGVSFQSRVPRARYNVLIVPPLWANSKASFERKLRTAVRHASLLAHLSQHADLICSACSGAVLLAEAKLLDQHRATTCWWLADWFSRRYPSVRLDMSRLVVVDGKRWTSAAGSAYLHLCLQLVKELGSEKIGNGVGRLTMVDERRGSQSPFTNDQRVLASTPLTKRALQLIERKLAARLVLAALARELGTTERTLHRHFRAEFGQSPSNYVQSRRVARAKQLLSEGRLSLEEVVERCGYSDVASFRKLFTREVGMTPRMYVSHLSL